MLINEVEHQYRTRLWSDIKQYVGKGYFIHFGQTPKMGVRVEGKFHSDPYGVYFYDLDWLAKSERFARGEQFGTNWPYWTIVERLPDDHGVILSRLAYDEIDEIAARNRWVDWENFRSEYFMNQRATKNPADLFWKYIRACSPMARGGKHFPTQNAALKGISYVYDDGSGTIHGGEPYQMVVFDPRIIRVVATGRQGQPEDDKLMNGHRFAFVELLKKLRGEYGGEINWKAKIPTLKFSHRGASFKLTWFPSGWDAKLRMEVEWGRASKSFSFSEGQFHIQTMDAVMKFFTDIVEKFSALAAAGKDIFFKPVLSEKDALSGVKSLIDTTGYAYRTEINNDHKQMTVLAEKTDTIGDRDLTTVVYCTSGEYVRWSVNISIGHYTIAAARVPEDLTEVPETLKTNFEKSLESVHPNNDGYGGKFYYQNDYQAFIGMVAELSGIKSLKSIYSDEISIWRNTNKEELYRDIRRIY